MKSVHASSLGGGGVTQSERDGILSLEATCSQMIPGPHTHLGGTLTDKERSWGFPAAWCQRR